MEVVPDRGAEQPRAKPAGAELGVGPLEDRDPNQSSRRPIISVMTGPIASTGKPSASRRRRPRSTASAAATAWATENETVALTLTPR
jgi:hypothetical protein